MPASSKCVRSCQPSNFGPTITTCGRSSIALNNSASAVGAGAQSSWINQIHSCSTAFGNLSTASEIACPKPVSESVAINGIRADFNNFVDASSDPVSTAVIKSIGRVCEVSAATTSGNQTAPLWETRTAVTRCLSTSAREAISTSRYLLRDAKTLSGATL